MGQMQRRKRAWREHEGKAKIKLIRNDLGMALWCEAEVLRRRMAETLRSLVRGHWRKLIERLLTPPT
jgi:hypothetical protein